MTGIGTHYPTSSPGNWVPFLGYLVCNYSYHDSFSPAIFLGGPSYLYEFKRKVSSSKYAVASYKATWRKLQKYVLQSYTSN